MKKIILGSVLTVAVISVILITSFLRPSATPTGQLVVDGLEAPIKITYDDRHVPYVAAESYEDLLFALGFVHASDRLWQMDLMRHAMQGRLSELFGSVTLEADARIRILGFPRQAKVTAEHLESEDRSLLESYAAGVNAYLTSKFYRRTLEHTLLRQKPAPWTIEDTLSVSQSPTFALFQELQSEITNAHARRQLNEEELKTYLVDYPEDGHIAMTWPDLAKALGLPIETPAPLTNKDGGVGDYAPVRQSNNWVVSGNHTQSGAPLLAGDPHIPFSLPAFWYLAHLKSPGLEMAGGTLPGTPAIAQGRNNVMAFTATVNTADTADLYFHAPGFVPMSSRTETIKVKGGEAVSLEISESQHGPLLDPKYFPETQGIESGFLSVRWTALDPVNTSTLAMMHASKAQTIPDWLDAMRKLSAPNYNYALAHIDGTTGLAVVGRIPIRRANHESMGRWPTNADNLENTWSGLVEPSMMPFVLDPTSGILVTANARSIPPEYPWYIGAGFAPPSRAARIQTLLEQSNSHDYKSFRAIHLDNQSDDLRRIMPLLLATNPADKAGRRGLALLNDWDQSWDKNHGGPMLYLAWKAKLHEALFEDDVGSVAQEGFIYNELRIASALRDGRMFCDNKRTENVESCEDLLTRTLTETVQELEAYHGAIDSWRWGAAFTSTLPHSGFAALPFLGSRVSRTFNGDAGLGTPAGPGAPNIAYVVENELPEFKNVGFAPTLRMIFDLDNLDGAQFSLAGGQSGDPRSQHYDDLLEIWLAGEYFKMDPPSEEDKPNLILSPS